MKLKALAAVIAATPLMVACGSSTEKAEAFKLKRSRCYFPCSPVQLPGSQNMAQETGNQVNYQAVGSGAGVRQFTLLRLLTSVPVMVL